MLKKIAILIACLVFVLTGCDLPRAGVPATRTPPPTAVPPTHTAEATQEGIAVQEAILILAPGPGSRLVSPMRLAGVADPGHEQTLVMRALRPDGSELIAPQPINLAAPLGERGPFEVEVPFTVSEEEQVFVQVYALSARDGGVTHLASVAVRLSASGPENIIPWGRHPEQIVITAPTLGETLSGGVAHIEGVGIASFEGTFVLEVLDAGGVVVGSQPVITHALDMGLPGTFNAEVPYSVFSAGPGRVVVRDPSPAFGGDVHLASVEIQLEP